MIFSEDRYTLFRIMLQVPQRQPLHRDIVDQPRRADSGGDQDA
jgi:hypothetical protein